MTTRTERDSMGEMEVPSDILHGASTQRAVLNFPISGRPVPASVIQAFAHLKEACAGVNAELGRLDPSIADAIAQAAQVIRSGLNGKAGALVAGSDMPSSSFARTTEAVGGQQPMSLPYQGRPTVADS